MHMGPVKSLRLIYGSGCLYIQLCMPNAQKINHFSDKSVQLTLISHPPRCFEGTAALVKDFDFGLWFEITK